MPIENPSYFPNFAWAVPLAFADPLSDCHFELGDTLYENQRAYTESWADNRKTLGRAIQVLAPARGVAGKITNEDDSALADSWHQEVKFDLHNLSSDESETIISTQGRLYTLLWQGDLKVLDLKTSAPPIPFPASELKKRLPEAEEFFQTEIQSRPKSVHFLTPTDSAAGLYREKFLKIQNGLESEFETTTKLVSANDLGLDQVFFPTVQVALFEMTNCTKAAVEKALQDVLYKPAANRKTTEVRFRLHAHGLLI